MIVSENTLKWAMRFYPPFLFQRIWVKNFQKGFYGAEIKIFKSLFNRNYNNSIFGGTIFCATDPFFAILFDQKLKRKGLKIRIWIKSADIQYIKPAFGSLYFKIGLTDKEISEAEYALATNGKFVKEFTIQIKNQKDEICARVNNTVHIKNLDFKIITV